MNLRLKPFEKNIRRRVRRELRQSPAAWKEYRRVRRRREFHLPQWLFRCIVLLVVASAWTSNRKPTGTLVAMILLWAAASVTWRAGQLLIALRASPTLLVLAHVPIRDEDVFKFQWQTFLRVSRWSVLDFTALYGVLAERVGYGWDSLWVGLFLAMIQWLVMVSLAAGLLIYVRRRKFFRFAGVFAALAVLLAIGVDIPSLTQFLTAAAYWIPPMGWILYAVGISPAQNVLLGWWPALAMSATVFALPLFYRRLRTRYVMPEGVPRTEAVRGAVEAQRRQKSDGVNPDPCADIKAAIRSREFMKGFNWQRGGWVERLTGRWLTPEERVAAEFLSGGNPGWSRGMVKGGLFWAGLAALLYLFPGLTSMGPFFVIFFLLSAKNIFFKGWPGTALKNVSGSNIALCSVYPLGFWQIARVCLKVNLMRLAILLPLLLVSGFIALNAWNLSLGQGLLLGGKILAIILMVYLIAPLGSLSQGTNDGTKIRIMLLTVLAVIFLGGGCLGMFITDGVAAGAMAALFVGSSFVSLLVYGHAYNHNWFDLQNKPKTTTSTQSQ